MTLDMGGRERAAEGFCENAQKGIPEREGSQMPNKRPEEQAPYNE